MPDTIHLRWRTLVVAVAFVALLFGPATAQETETVEEVVGVAGANPVVDLRNGVEPQTLVHVSPR